MPQANSQIYCRRYAICCCLIFAGCFGNLLLTNTAVAVGVFAAPQDGSAPEGDTPAASFKDLWTEDAKQALVDARAQEKDLIFLFTGSDWCPPCKKLEEEVLGREDFQFESSKHFVLVKFDFLKNTPQADALVSQNTEMAKRYGVEGYPTVVLVDVNSKPFAITGYQEGGVENYLAVLEEFRQARITRDAKLKEAETATGAERARLLDEAISGMDELVVAVYYENVVKEIVELDNEDELGLRSKWNAQKESEMRKIVMTDILMVSRLEQPERAIEFIDEVMKEIKFPADEKLELMQIKLNLMRKLNDNQRLDQLLDEMINLEGAESETRERLIVKKILLMVGSNRQAEALILLEDSIVAGQDNMHLWKAKGDIFESTEQFEKAIEAYDKAISAASNAPDVLFEVVAAKADALYQLNRETDAIQTLDNFADNTNMPSDLRSVTLLHKAMMMRDSGRLRQARLAENRAIEITESTTERGEIEKMVQRLRAKYDEQ